MRQAITLILLAAMSAGCSGFSIYREFSIDDSPNTSTVVDSKQREVISFKRNGKDGKTVVCSEPSPDTFSAIGHALSASGGFSPVSKEVSLALSLALAESAGTIQRARSVQLLRDGLYAACLGYANGLTIEQYNRLLLNQLTAGVVFLAIEQLTPQAVPSSTTLNAGDASIKKEPAAPGKSGDKSEEKPKTPQPQKEEKPSTGNNTSGNTSPTGGKTNDNTQPGRLGAGNEESSFFRVLIADSPAVTTPKKEDQPKSETPKKEDPPKEETPKKDDSSKGASTNSYALPPPSPAAVQAVQYIASLFLHNAMVFECLDQVRTMQIDGKSLFASAQDDSKSHAGQLLDACIKNVRALAYRGSTGEPDQEQKVVEGTTPPPRLRPVPTPFESTGKSQ